MKVLAIAVTVLALGLGACANQTPAQQRVTTGAAIGALGGAAIGGIAGSTVGQGKGAAIAAVIGAVAGGLAGAAAEEGVTRKQGVEVTLKMDNGELLAVTQEDGGENFQPGERVRLLQDGGTTRVTR